jgi:hypothetical protein
MELSHLDENQVASLNGLFQLCREKMTTIHCIYFNRCFSNIQFLPNVDNKVERIDCWGVEEWEIPILIQFLASPRADGQQRVLLMEIQLRNEKVQKLMDAIKEV